MKKILLFVSIIFMLSFISSAAFPFPSTSYIDPSETEKSWSENEINSLIKSSYKELSYKKVSFKECNSFGYIKEEQYCSIDEIFVNQSESGKDCAYDFQCKSNLCLNKKCEDSLLPLIKILNKRIIELESKIKNMEIKSIIENIVEENKNNKELLPIISNSKKERSFFEKLLWWNKY